MNILAFQIDKYASMYIMCVCRPSVWVYVCEWDAIYQYVELLGWGGGLSIDFSFFAAKFNA